jgi:uncharacterized protein (TIGR03067 family)
MKTRMLFLLITGSLIGAVLAQPATTDVDKIKGTWVVVSATQAGESIEPLKDAKFVFDAGKMAVTAKDKDLNLEATVKLDTTKKPKEIDIVETSGPQKGVRMKGIYSLDGDELKMCFIGLGPNEKDQVKTPTEFNGNGDQMLYVLKRQKP